MLREAQRAHPLASITRGCPGYTSPRDDSCAALRAPRHEAQRRKGRARAEIPSRSTAHKRTRSQRDCALRILFTSHDAPLAYVLFPFERRSTITSTMRWSTIANTTGDATGLAKRAPRFGLVKRAMNRPPGPSDVGGLSIRRRVEGHITRSASPRDREGVRKSAKARLFAVRR